LGKQNAAPAGGGAHREHGAIAVLREQLDATKVALNLH
jgi:hypothetical protein